METTNWLGFYNRCFSPFPRDFFVRSLFVGCIKVAISACDTHTFPIHVNPRSRVMQVRPDPMVRETQGQISSSDDEKTRPEFWAPQKWWVKSV